MLSSDGPHKVNWWAGYSPRAFCWTYVVQIWQIEKRSQNNLIKFLHFFLFFCLCQYGHVTC